MPVLVDTSVSKVAIPNSVAQSSSEVIAKVVESVCYSRLAEEYMVGKYKESEEFWAKYNTQPSSFYFGGHDGHFRQVPALHQAQCGCFDPRQRPWFVAASSGPKNVVLVIDVSGSMGDDDGKEATVGIRMRMTMEAAVTIIDTLTVADSFTVIAFNTSAYQLGGTNYLLEANSANKERLKAEINKLKPDGATNFLAAFTTAFDVIDNTVENEETNKQRIAILFMTDGKIGENMTDTQREEETNTVNGLVEERRKQLSERSRNVTIFTYSLGDDADRTVTKTIACNTGGIWTPVDWTDCGNLVGTMSSYYKLFALGNQNAVAWVETYKFTSRGVNGTTVSVPVYDRDVDPPIFVGGELNAVCVYVVCPCNIISQLSNHEKLLPLTFTCHLSSRSLGWTKKMQSLG
jgi:Mg-chelatase subunit ChlD